MTQRVIIYYAYETFNIDLQKSNKTLFEILLDHNHKSVIRIELFDEQSKKMTRIK